MRRLLTWVAGGLGVAALVRQLLRRQPARPPDKPQPADPADELRAKLEEARGAVDDRDEFDAAEGTPLDEVERPPHSEAERPEAERPETEPPEAEPPQTSAEAPPSAHEPDDEAERQRSLEERRRRVHDKAQEALGHMRGEDD